VIADRVIARGLLPDPLLRAAVTKSCALRLRQERRRGLDAFEDMVAAMSEGPIAVETGAANDQHYELPPAFFGLCLGPRRKYSGCFWPVGVESLADAEDTMLALTCARAGIEDGMDVLDLGCGWGSLALYIAERYPACSVTAMSNSRTQAEHVAVACAAAGRKAVTPVTADIATFDPGRRFDRILSVEMFEHVRDYRELFARLRGWLEPGGRVFVHVFSHARFAYTFNAEDPGDWMGSRFFSGGQMPAHDLFLEFDDDLVTEERWWLEGGQYARTLEAWLRRYDEHAAAIKPILAATYGEAATDWWVDWRLFFLACAETFGYGGGREWGVSHYRFAPR
jgi:cyclopropane-fatty-acyl-phospholipid synthase